MDRDLVVSDTRLDPPGIRKCSIRATDIASRKFGRKIIANMVILGYMNSLLNLVTVGALEQAVSKSVPEGSEELNLKAVREGIKLAERELKGGNEQVGGVESA